MTAREAASKSPDSAAQRWAPDGMWWAWKDGNGIRMVPQRDENGEHFFTRLTEEEVDGASDWEPVRLHTQIRKRHAC
jgi:hypothetical protein